jgi:osmotically-inducible protein OsmY
MRSIKQTRHDGAGVNAHAETTKEKIAELAEAELNRSPYRALRFVTCACRDGVLILNGQLPSYHLKQIAQTAVASLPGVERIDNRIHVAAAHR